MNDMEASNNIRTLALHNITKETKRSIKNARDALHRTHAHIPQETAGRSRLRLITNKKS
jgi:hypothetical protein